MKMITLAAVLSAVALSGCVHAFVKDLTPEAKAALADHFLDKCQGGFHFSAGGATGQLGGGAHADLDLTGTCGPAMVPLSQVDKLAPAPLPLPPSPTLNDILAAPPPGR